VSPGWSDGAIVGLLLAISRPDLVRNLVSVGGNFNTRSFTPKTFAWMKSSTPESFMRDAPVLVERYLKATPDDPDHFPTVFEKTMKLWLNEPDISNGELAKITAPTMIMVEDKEMITIEHSTGLYRSINGAELCVVPGTTHFLMSERPALVGALTRDFVLRHQK